MHDSDDLHWRRLFHRWFIEYNPLYLVSAALVLVGVILTSRGLTGGLEAQLGISAIAEVYAWALIGGAALLMRIQLRRPAVMLALLAALYQCDLTLHTETCAHLGVVGALGSAVWLVGFVVKLRALAWAMKLRLSRSALVVASLGAALITLLPWSLRLLDGDAASALLGLGVFTVVAAGQWSSREVEVRGAEHGWAATVARRSLRATWVGWATMMLVHVGFSMSQHAGLHGTVVVAAGVLLCTRWVERESTTWVIALGTLGYIALEAPLALSPTAVMAAATLALRALRCPVVRLLASAVSVAVATDDAYRKDATVEPPLPPARALPSFVVAPAAARLRLLTGAAASLYLAAWTHGWPGGPWPSHVGWLDALLVGLSLWAFARIRRYTLLVPLGLGSLHLAVSLRLVPAPQSGLEWGVTSIGLGFALLLLSLLASVRWRHPAAAQGGAPRRFARRLPIDPPTL